MMRILMKWFPRLARRNVVGVGFGKILSLLMLLVGLSGCSYNFSSKNEQETDDTDENTGIEIGTDTETGTASCPFDCMSETVCTKLVKGTANGEFTCFDKADVCCELPSGTDTDTDTDSDTGTDTDTDSDTDTDCVDWNPVSCGAACVDCTLTATPVCVGGGCVECTDNAHCESTEFCNASNTCETDTCPTLMYAGSVWINDSADILGLAGVTRITGDLAIDGSMLTDLTGLECLELVDGSVRIYNSYSLESLAGLEALTTIGSYFRISGNTVMTTIANLESLDYIGTSSVLDIYNNAHVPTCEAENLRDHLKAMGWTGTANIFGNDNTATCE